MLDSEVPFVGAVMQSKGQSVRVTARLLGSPAKVKGKIALAEIEVVEGPIPGRVTLVTPNGLEALNYAATRLLIGA